MKERFEGDGGQKRLLAALQGQKVVGGDKELATKLAASSELSEKNVGDVLIQEGGADNDVYFILAGKVAIHVKGKKVAVRSPGEHVGEMAAIEPAMPRSATVVCEETCVVARIDEEKLSTIADDHPSIWRAFAKELVARLAQRNATIQQSNDKPNIFIICASESLSIAKEIQAQLSHEFLPIVWTNGIFFVSSYPLDDLIDAVDQSDFAIAIASADDVAESRGKTEAIPRDNVIFELGLFMGRLGRERTILIQPKGEGVKLPSDLNGLTTVSYKIGNDKDTPALLAPVCTEIGKHVKKHGVRS